MAFSITNDLLAIAYDPDTETTIKCHLSIGRGTIWFNIIAEGREIVLTGGLKETEEEGVKKYRSFLASLLTGTGSRRWSPASHCFVPKSFWYPLRYWDDGGNQNLWHRKYVIKDIVGYREASPCCLPSKRYAGWSEMQRRSTFALVLILTLLLMGSVIGAYVVWRRATYGACGVTETDVPGPPNATMTAREVTDVCIFAYRIWLREKRQGPEKGDEVFVAQDDAPFVRWESDSHLVIVVNWIFVPLKSLRWDRDVEISYKVSSSLTEDSFRKLQENRLREMEGDMKLSDFNKISVREAIAQDWSWYREFRVWMTDNDAQFE